MVPVAEECGDFLRKSVGWVWETTEPGCCTARSATQSYSACQRWHKMADAQTTCTVTDELPSNLPPKYRSPMRTHMYALLVAPHIERLNISKVPMITICIPAFPSSEEQNATTDAINGVIRISDGNSD